MNDQEATKVCGHEGCTCHTQNGAEYCSDSCRRAAEGMSASAHCRCGHAGCTGSEYMPTASDH